MVFSKFAGLFTGKHSAECKRYRLLILYTVTSLGFLVQEANAQLPPYANSYAPAYFACPSDIQWNRPAIGLNPAEAEWVQGRKEVVATALSEYLNRLYIGLDVSKYIEKISCNNYQDVPIMGLAISGGGWASA